MENVGVRAWRALGMQIEVLTRDPATLSAACDAVGAVLQEADEAISRFRADSELSYVNANAGRTLRVSPFFGGALMAALRAARRTDGAVDPTVGAVLRRLGYDRDFDRLGTRGGPILLRVEQVPGWQAVTFDPLTLTLRTPPRVELDLGCTGKAVTVDLAAEAARAAAGCGVLVGVGGDLRCAGPTPDGGWQVLASEERSGPGAGQAIAVWGGALATSSITARRWVRGDETFHHLIDPSTGLPADGPLRTATVAGSTCVDANLLATWALVRGDEAMACLRRQRVPARLVRRDGTLLHLGGWPVPVPFEGQVA